MSHNAAENQLNIFKRNVKVSASFIIYKFSETKFIIYEFHAELGMV